METPDIAAMAWAKSHPRQPQSLEAWLPLQRHLDDAAAVAERLWDEWLPSMLRQQIAVPLGSDGDGRTLVAFLAGCHDVGKASPAFSCQVPTLANRMHDVGLRAQRIPDDERRLLRHELAGQVALESWLTVQHGWTADGAQQLGVVVGGHHGVPPERSQLRSAPRRPHLLGDGRWAEVRNYLLDRAARRTGASDRIDTWHELRLPQPVQVLLTGIVIVADWIASNDDLFPLADIDDEQPVFDHESRVRHAWEQLRLPSPWRPTQPRGDAHTLMRHRFDLPEDATARPVQVAAVDAATTMDVPGVMVVEAPMGEGKTEAALLAAEVLAARTGAGGCFVALPTQATSDAMFVRILDWLARLPDAELADDAAGEAEQARSVTLAHGKATLNATFRDLRMRGRSRNLAVEDDSEHGGSDGMSAPEAIVHNWLSGRKKGPLASFMVGTVDQLLFGSLRARHLALRHLGLANKVVVVDEVHAYDAYMSVYLARALEWLGAYGTPVVLLSATLPNRTRTELVDAYRRGVASQQPARGPGRRVRTKSWQRQSIEPVDSKSMSVYPAVTTVTDAEPVTTPVDAAGRSATVRLETAVDDLSTLTNLLDDATADGGCVLVVRNTVSRAQETVRALRQTFGDVVTVAHSRFLGRDRVAKDTWLRESFGPPGHDGDSPSRPYRAIVVATQVVEQSLDVDFDLLVTDLAPIDLMLQRIGRMHRHRRGHGEAHRPVRLREPRCVVVGVEDWTTQPPKPVAGSTYVYDRYALYRAAALVTEALDGDGTVTLPGDLATLVQRAYGDGPLGPPDWRATMDEARLAYEQHINAQRSAATGFLLAAPAQPGQAIVGWLHGNAGEADDSAQGQAQVRDSEDSIEVVVLQESGEQLRIPDWVQIHGGELVPMNEPPSKRLAAVIGGCSVRLPAYLIHGRDGDQLIEALEKNWYPQLQQSRLLAGQLMLVLDDDRRRTYGPWSFHYDAHDGLEVSRA